MKTFMGFVILFCGSLSWSNVQCDEDVLERFRVRAQCWDSNSVHACEALPLLASTAGAAALLSKYGHHPEYQALKKFLDTSKIVSMEMNRDFRKMLDTYFKLKSEDLRAQGVDPKSLPPLREFTFAEYEKYKDKLNAAHPNNFFLKLMERDKHKVTNDYSQRVFTYALERMDPKEFSMKDIAKVVDAFPSSIRVTNSRMKLDFREASVKAGFPQNGDSAFSGLEARKRIIEDIKQRNRSHKQSLEKEGLKLEGQTANGSTNSMKPKPSLGGKATIGAMGIVGAVASVGVEALPTLIGAYDINTRKADVAICAQNFGLDLSDDEALEIANAVRRNSEFKKSDSTCDAFAFTASGSAELLEKGTRAPKILQFLCGFESEMAIKEDNLDKSVTWDPEACSKKDIAKGELYTTYKDNMATIYTTSGTQVEIKWNEKGEWDPSTIKSLNDSEFGEFLKSSKISKLSSENLNPRLYCGSRQSGRYPDTLCQVTKAMRVLAQNRSFGEKFCKSNSSAQPSAVSKGTGSYK